MELENVDCAMARGGLAEIVAGQSATSRAAYRHSPGRSSQQPNVRGSGAAICRRLHPAGCFGIPVKYVGVGEGIEDLRDFRAREFVDALFDAEDGKST